MKPTIHVKRPPTWQEYIQKIQENAQKIEVVVKILVTPAQIANESVKVLIELKDQSDAGFLE